jgi:polysaccharide pyruvyl transferase WcaK-like protein
MSKFFRAANERRSYLHYVPSRLGLICGGSGNLGDDSMVEAAHHLLFKAKLFRFGHPKQEYCLNLIGLAGQRYFDSVILGGGTLISPHWVNHTRTALKQGLPLWTLGTGVGSSGFDDQDSVEIEAWKPLLMDFKRISVRGPKSKEALASIDINNVEVIGDLALSLTRDYLEEPSCPRRFAINIALPKGHDYRTGEYARLQELEEVLRKLISNGYQPVPVAMHWSDVLPLKQLMQRTSMGHIPVSVIPTADEFFGIVGSCSFTIGVRLHSAVLSCCVGVPPLMLGYRNKCLDFMQSMELEEWYVALNKAKPMEVVEKALLLSESAAALRPVILFRAQAWKQKIKDYVKSVIS